MTSFLVLEEVVLAREPPCMTLARRDGATVGLWSVNFAFVPVETPFIAESRVFAAWNHTGKGFGVLILVFPNQWD
jgi:hypothetical protein